MTSVDALVEGVHFDRAHASPRSIGHKALATALSDLAAMGALPGEAYVQLGLPDGLDTGDALALADGLGAVAARHGVAVAGGDVSRAAVLFLAVTAVGYVSGPERAVPRSGAMPGDRVVLTGELGGAAAGLLALRDPGLATGIDPTVAEALRRRQLEPEPRLGAGAALAAAGARAMIDLSDGLGADCAHVAAASGVRIEIELARLPVQAGVGEIAGRAAIDPLDLAAAGGEDYELLAALPADRVDDAVAAVEAAGTRLAGIGVVAAGTDVVLTDPSGVERRAVGFDQLAPRPAPGGRS